MDNVAVLVSAETWQSVCCCRRVVCVVQSYLLEEATAATSDTSKTTDTVQRNIGLPEDGMEQVKQVREVKVKAGLVV